MPRHIIDIKKEDDLERLRAIALDQQHELDLLTEIVLKQKAEIQRLRDEEASKRQRELDLVKEILAKRNRMLFGDSSEKRAHEDGKGAADAGEKAKPKRGHGRSEQPELERVEMVHDLGEPDRVCPQCGGQLQEWVGQFEASEEITGIERQYVIVEHKRKKYRCRCQACVETAPGPNKLKNGSRYSPEFAVDVALAKYCDHLPLQRQVKLMKRQGLVVGAHTLWDQLEALAGHLEPSYRAILDAVLTSELVYADETWWRLMDGRESGRKHWLWAVANEDLVGYRIQASRGKEAAQQMLGGYRGIVMADGYGVYASLARDGPQQKLGKQKPVATFQLVHCWAHARRKFVDIEANYPEQCGQALGMIGELYAVEREASKVSDRQKRQSTLRDLRQERSKEILGRLRAWAEAQRVLPESGLGKALNYMLSLWGSLTSFVDDPRIPLDNNHVERALRGPVVGRKNHYGSRSENGTHVAELFYTMIESAKLSGVNPREYLLKATWWALQNPGTATLPSNLIDG